MDPRWKAATRAAHAGDAAEDLPPSVRSHVPPLYQSVGFEYDDAAHAEDAALGRLPLYARDGNPTEEALARAVADLEGAEAALTFSSGMGAIAAALEAHAEAGAHVVGVVGLYGGTHELLTAILPRFGVRTSLAAAPTVDAIAQALTAETRAVLVESISNPLARVADVDGIAALCRARGVALLVDATFASPILQRPLARGATLSIHSATKYLGGHGDALAGVVSGDRAAIDRVRRLRKFHGAVLDPFAAWLVLRGLRTLALRVGRQVASAGTIARALASHSAVENVHWPGLADHPDHALAATQLDGAGAIVSFDVRGGLDGARRVYDRLRLVTRAASLGDVTSLMTHPATFSHVHVDAETRRRAGIGDGLLRLSVGIEDAEDVVADLMQALG